MKQPLYFREVLLSVIYVYLGPLALPVFVLLYEPQPGLLLLLEQQFPGFAEPQPVLQLKCLHVPELLCYLCLIYLIFNCLHRLGKVLTRQGICGISDMALDKLLNIAIFLLQELAVLIYLLERQLVEHVALRYEDRVIYHLR